MLGKTSRATWERAFGVPASPRQLVAAAMRCIHCGDELISDRERERGLCVPCVLDSYRDGRQWLLSRLTMLCADRPKPDTTDDERREASPE